MKRLLLPLLLIILPCLSRGYEVALHSRWGSRWDYCSGARVDGDLLMFCCYEEGLKLLDVSTPELPTEIGSNDWMLHMSALDRVGDTLYGTGGNGIRLLDITNPRDPLQISHFSLYVGEDRVSGTFIHCQDTLALVGYGRDDLYGYMVVDIADTSLEVLATFPGLTPRCLRDSLLVATATLLPESDEVYLVNVSDWFNPVPLDTLTNSFSPFLSGDTLYVSDDVGQIIPYDVSDPLSPFALGEPFDLGSFVLSVFGDILLLRGQNNMLRTYDITDLSIPSLLSSVDEGISYSAVVSSGRYTYNASGTGLNVLYVSEDGTITIYPPYYGVDSIDKTYLYNDMLVIHDRDEGFFFLDVSDTSNFRLVARKRLEGDVSFSYLKDMDYRLAAVQPFGTSTILIYDVRDIHNMQQILSFQGNECAIEGNLIWTSYDNVKVRELNEDLIVMNSDVYALDTGTVYILAQGAFLFAVQNFSSNPDILYIFEYDGNQIELISSLEFPINPAIYHTEPSFISGDYLYINSGFTNYMVNIGILSHPILYTVEFDDPEASIPLDNSWPVAQDMVLSNHNYLLDVLDFTDPIHPVIRSFWETPYESAMHSISVDERWAYIDDTISILILDYADPLAVGEEQTSYSPDMKIELVSVYPNPFNSISTLEVRLAARGRIRAMLYNELGRRVALLADGQFPAGTVRVPVEAGNLASGVYLLRVESFTGAVDARKITLVK